MTAPVHVEITVTYQRWRTCPRTPYSRHQPGKWAATTGADRRMSKVATTLKGMPHRASPAQVCPYVSKGAPTA